MALDKVPVSMMIAMESASETAPSNPTVGQRWYRASTATTYQYTNDGASSFWLDISSSGIGTSATRSVDFVGDTDPHLETNLGVVGSVYYNREKNRYFVCTTATSGAQVWSGRYAGLGGVEITYKSGSDFYRVHTFLSSGTFYMDTTTSVDYLVVAGGGGGGHGEVAGGGDGAGGGGGGGFRTAAGFSVAAGTYPVTIGDGGRGRQSSVTVAGASGGNSVFSTITATGGGGGGSDNNAAANDGLNGGSGGGAASQWGTTNPGGDGIYDAGQALGHVLHQGRDGGDSPGSGDAAGNKPGAGGGGAGGVGAGGGAGSTHAGDGGVGEDQVMGLNAADSYALLTAASVGHVVSGARYFSGGGGGGCAVSTSYNGGIGGSGGGGYGGDDNVAQRGRGTDGILNTGGGGGGGDGVNQYHHGGSGGSGIVVIRYQINA